MNLILILGYYLVALLFTLLFYIASSLVDESLKNLFRISMTISSALFNTLILLMIFQNGLFLIPSIILTFSIFKSVSRNKLYHTVLSYLNFILPLSWLVILPGMLLALTSLIMHPVVSHFHIKKIKGLPAYASLVLSGGLIKPRQGYVGFNMGCCTFLNAGAEHVTQHELGHQLNLAVFGGWFHYIGAIDENFIQKNPCDAYAEKLADSICCPSHHEWSIWSKP